MTDVGGGTQPAGAAPGARVPAAPPDGAFGRALVGGEARHWRAAGGVAELLDRPAYEPGARSPARRGSTACACSPRSRPARSSPWG